ncbi:MAG: SAM-dependent methyltransferase [Halieaceae bacterium]|jgi:SAM-dependent methyltransferase
MTITPDAAASNSTLCPMCQHQGIELLTDGVKDFEYLSPGTYAWVRCTRCELVRVNPIPDAEQLTLAYPPHYHSYQEPESAITRWLMSLSLNAQSRQFCSYLSDGDAVQEIGCSTGVLLEAIGQRGNYELNGVEYQAASAAIAQSKGLSVQCGSFEDCSIPSDHFNLIIMQHVLEHVTEPRLTLEKCVAALQSGGHLVGELPNYDCWDAALFGRYWGGGHAPRHIWHFTPDSLSAALNAAGFTDIQIRPSLHTGHWACSFQNYFRRNRSDSTGLKNGRAWYYPLFLLATIPINMLQMLFKKTGIIQFECTKP